MRPNGITSAFRAVRSGSTFAETPSARVAAKKRLPKRDWCPRGLRTSCRLQLRNRLARIGIVLVHNADHPSEVMAMARSATQRGALSIGQLARRWGLGADRVRRLVENGLLPGSFKVPSAGRYGEAVRIPLSTVLQAEDDWAVVPSDKEATRRKRRGRRRQSSPTLENFPELSASPLGHVGECHEDGQR